jgi:hypothetical protein
VLQRQSSLAVVKALHERKQRSHIRPAIAWRVRVERSSLCINSVAEEFDEHRSHVLHRRVRCHAAPPSLSRGVRRTPRISCEAVPPSIWPAGAQGGTSARRTGAALSFVSCIRLFGGSAPSLGACGLAEPLLTSAATAPNLQYRMELIAPEL